MDDADSDVDFASGDVVRIAQEGEYHFALDEATGVSSQGPTKPEALENLAVALRSYEESVTEDDDGDAWLG